jgi:gliding motility-associated-like protein
LFATNNSGGLLLTNLKNNDTVSAQSIGGVDCLLPATTNRLIFKVASPDKATVTIQSTVNGVCLGENISFTSVQTNGGANPKYIWRVNGQQTTVDNPALTLSKPPRDVMVQLEMVSSIACVAPVNSNEVEVRVFSLPSIQFSQQDTVIRLGTPANLNPSIQSSSPIARYVWSPATSLNNAFILNPQANPVVTTLYSLQATDQNNCSSQANFEVIVSGKLFMPNAFSPNNDGLNDQFAVPRTIFIDLKIFRVYNRWGQQVFETTNVRTGWDGTKNGMPLPSGAYAWVLQYRDAFTGGEETLKGAVMLIR